LVRFFSLPESSSVLEKEVPMTADILSSIYDVGLTDCLDAMALLSPFAVGASIKERHKEPLQVYALTSRTYCPGAIAVSPFDLLVADAREVVTKVARAAGTTATKHLRSVSPVISKCLGCVLRQLIAETGSIYICGATSAVSNDVVECYSPRTGESMVLPETCIPRQSCAFASADGRCYVIGGDKPPNCRLKRSCQTPIEYFEPLAERWEEGCPVRAAFTHSATAAGGGCLYLLGGLSDDGALNQVLQLDLAHGIWEKAEPMLLARFECAATFTRGRLFAVGGANAKGEAEAAFEQYDPTARSWSQMPPMGCPRFGCAAAAMGCTCQKVIGCSDFAAIQQVEDTGPS